MSDAVLILAALAFVFGVTPAAAGDDAAVVQLQPCSDFDTDTWQTLTLPFGEDCWFPSIAVDQSGHPCIAYQRYLGGGAWRLDYSRYNGAQWLTTVVDASQAEIPSLAFGPDGKPVIVAWGRYDSHLSSYTWDGVSWIRENICNGDPKTGSSVRLRFDENGIPHVTAFSQSNDLVYATDDGGGWMAEWLGNLSEPDVAPGPGGYAFISHTGGYGTYSPLYLSFFDGDQWQTSVLSENTWVDGTAMGFESDGTGHIIWGYNSGDIRHSWDAGPAWSTETVQSGNVMGADMAVGPDDALSVVYQDALNRDLIHAGKPQSGSWDIAVVDWQGYTGFDPSIALDGSGNIFIAYMQSDQANPTAEGQNWLRLCWFGNITGLGEEVAGEPFLLGITPNPARGFVHVPFFLGEPAHVTLELLDISGRTVRCIEAGLMPAGTGGLDVALDVPGVYFAVLHAGGLEASASFVLLE
jgi:hypothetical protein